MNLDGTINAEGGAYAGLTIQEARKRILVEVTPEHSVSGISGFGRRAPPLDAGIGQWLDAQYHWSDQQRLEHSARARAVTDGVGIGPPV